MNHADVERGLSALATRFRPLLDGTGSNVLMDARAEVTETWRRFEQATQPRRARIEDAPPWGYEIRPHRPLVFRPTIVDEMQIQADIFCKIAWREPEKLPVELNLVVRVWCLDLAVAHRPRYDAQDLRDEIQRAGRRVMVRYHFDLADPLQTGPRFHMQVGGNARADELCWLPETLSVPRMNHHPVDVMLACELVALNFCGEDGGRLLKDPTVVGAVRASEAGMLRSYYEWCVDVLRNGRASLQSLSMKRDLVHDIDRCGEDLA